MQNIFRIVIIVPHGYKHSMCFTEVAFLLKNSITDCGFSCDIAINDMSRDRINILLGYHLIQFGNYLSNIKYIPYQLEQLSSQEFNISDNIKSILANAYDVWDYSLENIKYLEKIGIKAKYLPIGYSPYLEMIPKKQLRDIDVLFFGSVVDRREKILKRLKEMGLKVHSVFGIYGKERDEFISRSKAVINIHFYSSKIFEAVRISYLLNNACFVISEESEAYCYPKVNLTFSSYESLAQKCCDLLKSEKKINEIANKNYLEFKENYPMKEFIKKVL